MPTFSPGDNSKSNGAIVRANAGYPVPPGYAFESSESQASLRDQIASTLDLVFRRKWTFVAFLFSTLAAVAAYTFLATPIFKGSSFVIIDLEDGGPAVGSNYGDDVFVRPQRSVEGELMLLQISNPLAGRVAERLAEMEVVPGTEQPLSVLVDEEGEPLSAGSVAWRLSDYVEFAAQGRDANVVRITASSGVAGEAALISNLYADEYVKLTQEANRSQLSASRRFLEQQEEKWRAELYEAEEAVSQYGSVDGSGVLDQQGAFLVQQIALLEAQRDQINIDMQIRRSALSAVEQELQRASPQMATQLTSSLEPEIESIRTRIANLELTRKEILLRYPDVDVSQIDHPELRRIESQLTTFRADLADLSRRYIEEVNASGGLAGGGGISYVAGLRQRAAEERITISGYEAQIASINSRLQTYLTEMRGLPGRSLQVARLERKREHSTQMYESVVSRLQEVLVAEQSRPGYARVIREAHVPFFPAEPDPSKNLLLALLLGLLLGGAAAVIADKIDNRIFKPDWVQEQGYDVIGVVPDMAILVASEFDGKTSVDFDGRTVSTALTGLLSPSSAVTETYRSLRTHIQFSGGEKVIRKILVTSASMGEGKSVTASNLALVMAQAGRKTVLLDADLRRPRIHTLFGVDQTPGVSDLLRDVKGDLASYEGPTDNLTVIPSGSAVDRPAEMVGSPEFRDLLLRLSNEFDIVIIDSPPVRAATDSVLLSTQCDGTVLVTRAAQTKQSELELAVNEIRSVGGNLLGVVFNAFDLKMAYGYKYMYSDYEHYSTYSTYGDV